MLPVSTLTFLSVSVINREWSWRKWCLSAWQPWKVPCARSTEMNPLSFSSQSWASLLYVWRTHLLQCWGEMTDFAPSLSAQQLDAVSCTVTRLHCDTCCCSVVSFCRAILHMLSSISLTGEITVFLLAFSNAVAGYEGMMNWYGNNAI